jgi:hypothetical protein
MADEYGSSADAPKKGAKKAKGSAKSGEQPKAFVRLRKGASGAWEAEVQVVGADAAGGMADGGWTEVPLPEDAVQEYPKWLFHEDGRRQVVSNKAEADKLEGYSDEPPEPDEEDIYGGAVPPPAVNVVGAPTSTRGPVPVDRG